MTGSAFHSLLARLQPGITGEFEELLEVCSEPSDYRLTFEGGELWRNLVHLIEIGENRTLDAGNLVLVELPLDSQSGDVAVNTRDKGPIEQVPKLVSGLRDVHPIFLSWFRKGIAYHGGNRAVPQ